MPHDDSIASSQSLERGLAILGSFTPDRPALGISELAQRLGLTRSTTHRYVATLARLGFLDQDELTRKMQDLRTGTTTDKEADTPAENVAAEPAA